MGGWKEQLIDRGWLNRESLPRDNRSHAPVEVRSKCLDKSRICLAPNYYAYRIVQLEMVIVKLESRSKKYITLNNPQVVIEKKIDCG
ncbi:MAG: hypothetical protein EAZ98_14665 [Oscillatoriales cyanobacterium]|uniref:hypothetical protein n=1 Tax=Microcoleus anatoxicus TaxID=2705319 RepID=UPI0030C99BC5|nr:MAG: hypothetical protein EAZ98_14665 [Oscillatoriales cyanobacterium]